MRAAGLMFVLAVSLVASACGKKTPPAAAATPVPSPAAQTGAGSAAGKDDGSVVFQRVHFDLNRWDLSAAASRSLSDGAKKLLADPKLRLRVEGHADERGGTQYNLALSLRRAEAIRKYLVDLGIEPARIEVLAFGEERPIAQGHDESAWSKNRRGEMTVKGAATR